MLRLLLSSITLDLPDQCLKLSLRSGVETRRPSQTSILWRENPEVWPRCRFFGNRNQTVFSGSVKFQKKRQNAYVFRDKFPKHVEFGNLVHR